MAILSANIHTGLDLANLELSLSLETLGGLSSVQSYDGMLPAADRWQPDYTVVPLSIRPVLGVFDPEGVRSLDNLLTKTLTASESLTGTWELVRSDGTVTTITSATPGFTVESQASVESGGVVQSTRFQLKMSKNLAAGEEFTLRFKARYGDGAGNYYDRTASATVRCESAGVPSGRLVLDSGVGYKYYPLRMDMTERTTTAHVYHGDGEILPSSGNCRFFWLVRDGGTWKIPDPVADFGLSVSTATGNPSVTVRVRCVDSLRVRCMAVYTHDGMTYGTVPQQYADAATAGTLPSWCATPLPVPDVPMPGLDTEFGVERVLDIKRMEIGRIATVQSPGVTVLAPEAMVFDHRGLLDPDKHDRELRTTWKTCAAKADGSIVGLATVGTGRVPVISADNAKGTLGGNVYAEIDDSGPLCALTAGGKYLTVGGDVLVAKKN